MRNCFSTSQVDLLLNMALGFQLSEKILCIEALYGDKLEIANWRIRENSWKQ